jgi:hypothetical protein
MDSPQRLESNFAAGFGSPGSLCVGATTAVPMTASNGRNTATE